MKRYLLIYSKLLIICILTIEGCNQRSETTDSYTSSPQSRSDSQNAVEQTKLITANCDEKEVKAKFLEWMELYYPDWPIKGKIKVFEVAKDRTTLDPSPCIYDIRFQTIDPHMGGYGEKQILVFRFAWDNLLFQNYSIKPIRGVLY